LIEDKKEERYRGRRIGNGISKQIWKRELRY
jgi:hypothetical protein